MMATALLVPATMAKKKPRDDQAVKIDRKLVMKAQLIAKTRGISVAEYLSELLRQPIEKDFPKALSAVQSGDA